MTVGTDLSGEEQTHRSGQAKRVAWGRCCTVCVSERKNGRTKTGDGGGEGGEGGTGLLL